ncbi:hypothetical protein [Armatimonas sp.]|uniref:hypothetical protein n=1 Tax=Armatimonas sp. TaxID=1872638 RepID=UPI00374C8F63
MMKQKFPRLFAFFTCFAVTLTTSLTASAQTKPVRVFILAGQSNMEGQGFIAAERPEFKGNVAFVGTKAFWRTKEESPTGQGYHWNTNAETYYLIGEAMGEAMKKLLTIK